MAGDVELEFGDGYADGATSSIAANDALIASFEKLAAATERVKDPKFQQADKHAAVTAELNQQASLAAKIASFDPARTRALAQQEALLKKMREDATGITAANE